VYWQDGELAMAYQTQRDINKVLQRDLEHEKKNAKSREEQLRREIRELQEDNERQQNLIGQVCQRFAILSDLINHSLSRSVQLSKIIFCIHNFT